MGNHEKALKVLALDLGDLPAAERYCDEMSEGKEEESQRRRRLLLTLLRICLQEEEGAGDGR